MDVAKISIIIGIVATVLSGIGIFFKKILPGVRKVMHFIDDMIGEPKRPGREAQPGLFERLDAIEHELHPNSGLSFRDSSNRQEAMLTEVQQTLLGQGEKLDSHAEKLDAQDRKLGEHIAACPPPTTTINVNGGTP